MIELLFQLLECRGIKEGFLGAVLAVLSVPFFPQIPLATTLKGVSGREKTAKLILAYIAAGTLAAYIVGAVVPNLPSALLHFVGLQLVWIGKFGASIKEGQED